MSDDLLILRTKVRIARGGQIGEIGRICEIKVRYNQPHPLYRVGSGWYAAEMLERVADSIEGDYLGRASREEIDILLTLGYSLSFSGTYATLYTISKGNEPEYRYHLTIEDEAKTQRYHESFRTLEQIVEHEPFDLSRFRVGKQKGQEKA